jgi:hypothetical protein
LYHLKELKNVAPLGFYSLRRNWPRVPEMVWDVACNWAYHENREFDGGNVISVGLLA